MIAISNQKLLISSSTQEIEVKAVSKSVKEIINVELIKKNDEFSVELVQWLS
ncbi:hypothetical protein JCM17136A_37110 [Phocaeicola sartorii JCM 17136 = DSM 21941]